MVLCRAHSGRNTKEKTAIVRLQPIVQYSELYYKKSLMAKHSESFSAGEAARITGVTYRNIDHWARTKFIVPSISDANGTGTERKYAFDDLVALRVARELRQAGVSTQALRQVVKYLREECELRNPLAESKVVVVGSDVQLVKGCEGLESLLAKPGQAVFAFMLDLTRTVDEIKRDVEALRAA
jgi:DNA-binding transcriptional MerR regulator